MKKIKQFFEEEMSGGPLTQEKVEWALQKFAALAWTDGYWARLLEDNGSGISKFQHFLNEDYTDRDYELAHAEDKAKE